MELSEQMVRVLASTCIGRRNDYALQREDGRYVRAGRPLTVETLRLHLAGRLTIGTYVIDEQGTCRFGVFDDDRPDGLARLMAVQRHLAGVGVPSYLELSRRPGHLWVLLAHLVQPDRLRRHLLPYCLPGMEFYPKQDRAKDGPGSLVRVPLGVHRLTGKRYPFVQVQGEAVVPVARTVLTALEWLSGVERATVPEQQAAQETRPGSGASSHTHVNQKTSGEDALTIAAWCRGQDPHRVIGRYVELDQQGLGCCPFGEHHDDGRDTHPSFRVMPLRPPSLNCWYCYVWGRGGSVFDFLRFYHGVSARDLWQRIRAGELF